jgi:hypothetical protein
VHDDRLRARRDWTAKLSQVHRWVVLPHRAGLEPGENSNQAQQDQRPEPEQSEGRAAYDEEGGDRESQGNNRYEGAKRAQSGLCSCSALKRYDRAATQKSPVQPSTRMWLTSLISAAISSSMAVAMPTLSSTSCRKASLPRRPEAGS